MTCIVGIRGESGALIAFDSLGGANGNYTMRLDLKGARLSDEVAFGYTYSYRFGQILEHHLDLPVLGGEDELSWAITSFVPAMHEALRTHGWLKKDSEREESGQLILAVRHRIFLVHSDHSVSESAKPYEACGSGDQYAKGALEAVRIASLDLDDEERATLALRAAAAHSAYVKAPWHFIRTVRTPVAEMAA